MNNISWFLYAVDVISSLPAFFGIIIVGLIVLSVARVINADVECDEEGMKAVKHSFFKSYLPIIIICSVVIVIIPSAKTMYLIMGSEVGEHVVISETGQRVQDAINKKLDEYLGES